MGIFDRWKRPKQPPPPLLMSYQVGTLQGLGTREDQQDAYGTVHVSDPRMIRERGLLLAVSDGMGGMEGGREAAETVISVLTEAFDRLDRQAPPGPQLCRLAEMAGQQVFERLEGRGGATLVACMVHDETLHWVSVGDSCVFLRRGPGIYRINQEQNYRQELYRDNLDRERLETAEADRDPDGPRLSSFLGMEELALEPEYSRHGLRLLDGDRVLLCSDGVGGVLSDGELLQCLSLEDASEVCRALDEAIVQKHRIHQDNYTALVLRCTH